MTPGASLRAARSGSRRSRGRSTRRRVRRASSRQRSRRRRKRTLVVAATLGVGIVAGVLIANSDRFQDTLREVTLPLRHDDIIRQQAREKGVDPTLIAAVIWQESKFRDQTSSAGARGLMQITPGTAAEIEKLSGGQSFEFEDLADPDINIRYGTFYLDYLLERYQGNEVAALAAYNAGPAQVDAWGGAAIGLDQIAFAETEDYVEAVLDKKSEYADHYAKELAIE
jgi:soluble lytic murein transglycosylase